ncbi:very-long-chain enoyl-CoA reductase [Elysia marginata]|uniref:Very-long-chain enoyl-CoA reductase n=1 Tax=Elysia marginata TaxID=1093978 RepID=A0AAV4GMX3_9GAST|nr:very-long-chain enoyl-CoA reductase [Elysia marginata]
MGPQMVSGKNKYRRHHYLKKTGIDMSAAFDTINREVLLKILEEIVKEDELRLIQFLLSNTQINTRIHKANIEVPFTSNVGTPQDDGLSPVLFPIYWHMPLKVLER